MAVKPSELSTSATSPAKRAQREAFPVPDAAQQPQMGGTRPHVSLLGGCFVPQELHFNICKQFVGARCYRHANATLLTLHVRQGCALLERKNLARNQAWIRLSDCGSSFSPASAEQKPSASVLQLLRGFGGARRLAAPLCPTFMSPSRLDGTVEICCSCLTRLVSQKLEDWLTSLLSVLLHQWD